MVYDLRRPRRRLFLFRYGRSGVDVTWTDVEAERPHIFDYPNRVKFTLEKPCRSLNYHVRVTLI
jgi:hypothetical protein